MVAKAKKVKADKTESASIINPDAVADYETTKVKMKDGTTRTSKDCGDEVAIKLRGKTMDELEALAEKEGFGDNFNKSWKHLNAGMVRMNLGNKMRAKLRAKENNKKAA